MNTTKIKRIIEEISDAESDMSIELVDFISHFNQDDFVDWMVVPINEAEVRIVPVDYKENAYSDKFEGFSFKLDEELKGFLLIFQFDEFDEFFELTGNQITNKCLLTTDSQLNTKTIKITIDKIWNL